MRSEARSLWKGAQAEFPLLIGVIPFGLIYGTLAVEAGLAPLPAQVMSSVVFAGSAQFIAAQLVHEAAPGAVIILSIAIVNLRHVLYSASMAPFLQQLSVRWRLLLSYLLTDEAYAPSIVNYQNEGSSVASHWFFLGAGLALWLSWQASTALGIFLGTTIPSAWSLDFALPLTFIAILTPMIKDRESFAAALSAAVVAVLAYGLPYKLGLVLAAAVGIVAGIVAESRE